MGFNSGFKGLNNTINNSNYIEFIEEVSINDKTDKMWKKVFTA